MKQKKIYTVKNYAEEVCAKLLIINTDTLY